MKPTTRLAPQRRAARQTLKGALQRLTMTLMLVMLTATTAWADDSGTCGAAGNENNVTWSFVSSTQTLTISGSGPMADFSNVNEDQPWKDYRDNITSVVIGDGVTTIGKNAFYLLKVLNSPVTIPSGVTSIGEQAFRKCEALPSVTIPAGVTSIGNYAFQKCESLTSIIIPNSVTTIGNNAFSSSGLTSVIIPSSVTSIGREAFGACYSMSKVLVMAGESPSTLGEIPFYNTSATIYLPAAYATADGWSNYSSQLWPYAGCWASGGATVFSSADNTTLRVENIDNTGAMADYADAATRPWASVAATVTKLEIIPAVTAIGQNAFNGFTAITDVLIPNNVTSIGGGAFNGCSSLTMVTAQRPTPPTLGANAFDGNAADRKIRAHVSYKTTDGWNAYADDIVAYSGVWVCGGVTLFYDGTTKQMTVEKCCGSGNMDAYQNFEDRPWNGIKDDIETVVVESGVTKIGYNAFCHCGNLTTVTIAETVTNIGGDAFRYCSNLATVYMLPATPPEVLSTFDDCSDDLLIIVQEEYLNTYYTSGGYWANYRERVVCMGSCGTDVKYYYAPSFHKLTISGTGAMADYADQSTRPWHSYIGDLQTVVIEPGVTRVGTKAFRSCNGITSLTIGSDVTSIGEEAFNGCSSLSSIHIPASVTSIGKDAFANCTDVPAITVAVGNTVYDSRDNCNAIIETNTNKLILGCINTTIPATVTEIGEKAFDTCGMTAIAIPYGVTTIGKAAFMSCMKLTSVTIPASVTIIGYDAFCGCSALASVTIYAPSLTTYGVYAFKENNYGRKIYVFNDCVNTYKKKASPMSVSENDIEAIPDVTVSGVTVNQNPEVTSDYWCTYYHPAAHVQINTDGVEIYKAALNGTSSVTLTKVEGNVIKAGQAVMLKAPASGSLSMELTPDAATGDYSGNELKGGSTVADGYTAYTLAAENNKMEFYKFAGAALNPNKAHLEIAPTLAPEYLGFDVDGETTGINEHESHDCNATLSKRESHELSGEWYTLDGRRLGSTFNVPRNATLSPRERSTLKKGLYIVNGKKVVIK